MLINRSVKISHERLLQVVFYDPETGKFHRRKASGIATREDGSINKHVGYRYICVDGQRYLAHRLAWFYMTGEWSSHRIDHRDTVKLNNKWSNLREATNSQNLQNSCIRKKNKCGFKGVYEERGRWAASIACQGRKYYIGSFDSPQEAHAAYVAKAAVLHGEFARAA